MARSSYSVMNDLPHNHAARRLYGAVSSTWASACLGSQLSFYKSNVERSVGLRGDDSQGLRRIAGGADHKPAGLSQGNSAHVAAEQIGKAPAVLIGDFFHYNVQGR